MSNTDTTVFIIIKEHFGGYDVSGFVDFIGDFEWQTFVFIVSIARSALAFSMAEYAPKVIFFSFFE